MLLVIFRNVEIYLIIPHKVQVKLFLNLDNFMIHHVSYIADSIYVKIRRVNNNTRIDVKVEFPCAGNNYHYFTYYRGCLSSE